VPDNFDEYECLDAILHRYNNIDYVMNMGFFEGIKLVSKMNIKIAEEHLWEKWNIEHVYMEKKNYMSFEDYKNKAFGLINTNVNIGKKMTAEEAIAEAEKIKEMDRKAGDK